MLYEELSTLTKGQCTFRQYEIIERLYNDCIGMTKQEAAALWHKTYGKELERRVAVLRKFEEELIATRDLPLSERGDEVWHAIHRAEMTLREKIGRHEGNQYTDEDGVNWSVCKWGTTPNGCYTIWTLGFIHNGEFEHVRYNFY